MGGYVSGTYCHIEIPVYELSDYQKKMVETKGVLAKNWTQKDDTTYEVELYDYIHDTEGNPITASDIKFCFDSALATKNYSKLEVIDSVTVLDDYKVEFKFQKLWQWANLKTYSWNVR